MQKKALRGSCLISTMIGLLRKIDLNHIKKLPYRIDYKREILSIVSSLSAHRMNSPASLPSVGKLSTPGFPSVAQRDLPHTEPGNQSENERKSGVSYINSRPC